MTAWSSDESYHLSRKYATYRASQFEKLIKRPGTQVIPNLQPRRKKH